MNRTGLTLSAVAATLVSLPAAAMLLGLPAAATARASMAPDVTTQAVTTQAVTTQTAKATCDWAPSYDTSAGHPVIPQSPTGNGTVTYAGRVAGSGTPGPASFSGIAPSAGGSWHQVGTSGQPGPSNQGHPGGSPCDWTPAYHVGVGHSVTALSSTELGEVIYAAWAGRIHGGSSAYGIATNYGGGWHQVGTEGLPKQYITGITVDSFRPAHAYAVYNEDSSRLFRHTSRCGCGTGHVFETWNAGRTWTNISGNLPSIAGDIVFLHDNGRLLLATAAGIYAAFESRGAHTCWTHLGSGLPRVAVEDLTVGSDNYIYAATHGHGTWRFKI